MVVAITVAAVAGFLLSGVLYALAPASTEPGHPVPTRSAPLTAVVELVRGALLAGAIAFLLSRGTEEGAAAGAELGLVLFVVPLVLLTGSVFHEGTRVRRAALHGVDWLLKLVVMGAVVGALS